jgi:hypothetical protein
MRPIVIAIFGLFLLSCGDQSSPGSTEPAIQQSTSDGDLSLTVSLDKVAITAADVIELTIEAAYPEAATLELPTLSDQFGEFLIESDTTTPARLIEPSRLLTERRLLLAPLSVGELIVPALRARATLEGGRAFSVEIAETPVSVTSLLPEETQAAPELRDIEDPLDPPIPTWWKLAALGIVLALIAGVTWWWRRPAPPSLSAPPPPVAPNVAALARLDQLGESGLLDVGRHQELYFELSDILREYIERQFSIQAQEQTTAEFFEALRGGNTFTTGQRSLLREFLFRADLIKFAKLAATPDQCLQAVESCRAFIVETAAASASDASYNEVN